MTSLFVVRDAVPADINFVVNSWITSFSAFSKSDGHVVRYTRHPQLVLGLVQRCPVTVACDPDDPDQAYGWLCHELVDGELTVHFAFTKHQFRRLGVADALLRHVNPAGDPFVATHAGFAFDAVRARYRITLDPYRLTE